MIQHGRWIFISNYSKLDSCNTYTLCDLMINYTVPKSIKLKKESKVITIGTYSDTANSIVGDNNIAGLFFNTWHQSIAISYAGKSPTHNVAFFNLVYGRGNSNTLTTEKYRDIIQNKVYYESEPLSCSAICEAYLIYDESDDYFNYYHFETTSGHSSVNNLGDNLFIIINY